MEKIKNYINGKNSVKGATWILIVTLTISNILGMIRDHFLAQKIPTDLLDTYYTAFRLPDLIFNLLILGAIAAAFIPVFTQYLSKEKKEEAWHIANSFLNISILILIASCLLLAVFMPKLIPLLVPQFGLEKQELTIRLARLMLLSPLFFGISYIFGGILNSFKRFLAYSTAPLVYNISIIIATLFLADKYNVWGIAVGVVIGAFLHMLIQIPIAIKLGYRYQSSFDFHHSGVRKIFKLMLPRTIGLGAMQLMLLAFTFIASGLAAGSIAIFSLADNIQTMPVVVFGTSFATAIFPSLSESYSKGENERFLNYIWKGIRSILYLLIPASIGVILLRAQIVRLILGSGFFGWDQTVSTANTLGYLALSLFAQGLVSILARAFYAVHNTKTPMYISIISFASSIIFAFIFSPGMGVEGLGLAFSLGSFLNVILLYIYLRMELPQMKKYEKNNLSFIAKILLATVIMGLLVQFTKWFSGGLMGDLDRVWQVLTQTLFSIFVGAGVYLSITWYLGCEEIMEIWSIIKKKFGFGVSQNEQ